jgi:hypothetical protein
MSLRAIQIGVVVELARELVMLVVVGQDPGLDLF